MYAKRFVKKTNARCDHVLPIFQINYPLGVRSRLGQWKILLGMVLARFKRGQIWEVDFEPQTHKEEPGNRGRPALVLQTDILNNAAHSTTIVVPGTSQTYRDSQGDGYPLRVAIGKVGTTKLETDLLIDQIRTISNHRFLGLKPVNQLSKAQMKRVEDALKILVGE